MFGLTMLLVFVGYLLVSVLVVRRAIGYARTHGKNAKRWGWSAALVMYLIPFWDWLPTVAVHQYYCATESGFWVYKTPEQWKQENPGVMEGLVANPVSIQHVGDDKNYTDTIELNQRFIHVHKYEGPLLFNRWRIETKIQDRKNGDVIAREIGFSTSQEQRQAGWAGWKFWLDNERCSIENHRDQGSFYKIMAQFEGAKK